MNADRIIMRPALWVRLIYVSGVAFDDVIIIGYMANAVSDSSMWVILIAILVMFLVPTLEANLMWFACDERALRNTTHSVRQSSSGGRNQRLIAFRCIMD